MEFSKERIESLLWVNLKCPYCGEIDTLRDHLFQYKMQVKDSEGNVISKSELLAVCPRCEKTSRVNLQLSKENGLEMDNSDVRWRKYPDPNLEGCVRDCIILKKDSSIEDSIFWTEEDSSHDHSPWQDTEYYLTHEDLKQLPKEGETSGPKLLYICAGPMCGDFKPEEMKQARSEPGFEDNTLVCPSCGGCQWWLLPKDEQGETIKDWEKYLEGKK